MLTDRPHIALEPATDTGDTSAETGRIWLGDQESNLGSQIQNLLSCP